MLCNKLPMHTHAKELYILLQAKGVVCVEMKSSQIKVCGLRKSLKTMKILPQENLSAT